MKKFDKAMYYILIMIIIFSVCYGLAYNFADNNEQITEIKWDLTSKYSYGFIGDQWYVYPDEFTKDKLINSIGPKSAFISMEDFHAKYGR